MEMLSTSERDLQKAAAAITAGELVAFPTETVYGLGADAFNTRALANVFAAKNRPRFDPLIIHIADLCALSRIVCADLLDGAGKERLAILSRELMPGPLTLVLPKTPQVPPLATSGLATVAVRFPAHLVAQKLIRLSTGAVAAPSANPFGYLSPTRAQHVEAQLGAKVDFIIDGGKTEVGVESTVLDISQNPPRILRPGGTSREAIEALIGEVFFPAEESAREIPAEEKPLSPGQLKSHYAPRTPLVLCRREELRALPAAHNEGRLYFSPPENAPALAPALMDNTRILSATGNPAEAAANLFDMLHELDTKKLARILAEEAPPADLGAAINDRLRRASFFEKD